MPHLVFELCSFMATFAKWRFATIIETTAQLLPLRELCETKIVEELFANAQEKKFISDFVAACKDKRTWKFVALTTPWVSQPMEHIRRWGLLCPCVECNQLRKEGAKHVECSTCSPGLAVYQRPL